MWDLGRGGGGQGGTGGGAASLGSGLSSHKASSCGGPCPFWGALRRRLVGGGCAFGAGLMHRLRCGAERCLCPDGQPPAPRATGRSPRPTGVYRGQRWAVPPNSAGGGGGAGMHWKAPPPAPGRPAFAQPLSPSQQVPGSMAFVTDSNRPQPLRQPPPTACLTTSRAASEVPSLLMHPWGGEGGAK